MSVCNNVMYEQQREGQHDKHASVMKALQTSCHSIQSVPLCTMRRYDKALL